MLAGLLVVTFKESVISKITGGEEFDEDLGSGVPMLSGPFVVAFG